MLLFMTVTPVHLKTKVSYRSIINLLQSVLSNALEWVLPDTFIPIQKIFSFARLTHEKNSGP